MKVHVVFEYLEDGAPIKGVFDTREAAEHFHSLLSAEHFLDAFGIETWEVENLQEVKRKWRIFQAKVKRVFDHIT